MNDKARATHTEIVPGRLYALGASIPLNGQVSWAPDTATGFQPLSCYLVRAETDILVDTGIGATKQAVLEGLEEILEPGSPLSIFMTRALMDCVGGLGGVVERYEIQDIFTGGVPNPFDQFESTPVTSMGVHRSPDDPPIEIFRPALKLLATYWGYEPTTRAAFTSDSFTHATVAASDQRPVIDSLDVDIGIDQVREHIDAAFWWLRHADGRDLIAEQIRSFFETHPVEIVAPTRGCALVGGAVVERHVDMVLEAISG